MKGHVGHMHRVLSTGQSLAASGHPQAQHILEQCQKLEGRWAELEQACEGRAHCLQQAVTAQQVGDQEDGVCRAADRLWEGGIVGPSGRGPVMKAPISAQKLLCRLLVTRTGDEGPR